MQLVTLEGDQTRSSLSLRDLRRALHGCGNLHGDFFRHFEDQHYVYGHVEVYPPESLQGFKIKLPKLKFKIKLPKFKFKIPKYNFKIKIPGAKIFKGIERGIKKFGSNVGKAFGQLGDIGTGIIQNALGMNQQAMQPGLPEQYPEDPSMGMEQALASMMGPQPATMPMMPQTIPQSRRLQPYQSNKKDNTILYAGAAGILLLVVMMNKKKGRR